MELEGSMSWDELLNSSAEVGQLLLESGAEIYRVEESILRICRAYGVSDCQVFAIPSLIIVSAADAQGHNHTKIRRLSERSTDLARVGFLNDLRIKQIIFTAFHRAAQLL